MIYLETFHSRYLDFKNRSLSGRYIQLKHIEPLLESYSDLLEVEIIGSSVSQNPVYGLRFGQGSKKILMWSQMHGNETTTTKALFDLFNYLKADDSFRSYVQENFTLYILPMLNPDGAEAYTRVNANAVDLNRDAQNRSQPESVILGEAFKTVQPDFCFNLHDQRTIFSAGKTALPATVSFLTPAEDKDRLLTTQRKRSMEVIGAMNEYLQKHIPGQVGRYDDGYNINCVGDTFQSEGIPTVLFESGHYQNDYQREYTRMYIACSMVCAINYIGEHAVDGQQYKSYFNIPENDKLFYDVILRNFPVMENSKIKRCEVAIQFKETLINSKIEFVPVVERIEDKIKFYGHKELNMNKIEVPIIEKYEINDTYLTKLLRKI